MSNPNKALGSALEYRVVNRAKKRGLPAKRQPYSGATKDAPNDVLVAGLLGECKVRSRHPSLSECLEWLYGAQKNAARLKLPGAFLVYNTKGEKQPRVLLDLDLFLDLLSQIREENY